MAERHSRFICTFSVTMRTVLPWIARNSLYAKHFMTELLHLGFIVGLLTGYERNNMKSCFLNCVPTHHAYKPNKLIILILIKVYPKSFVVKMTFNHEK